MAKSAKARTERYRIAVIPGDGIGNEVIPEGMKVLEAVARRSFVHRRRFGPTRENPVGLIDPDELGAAIERSNSEGYELPLPP